MNSRVLLIFLALLLLAAGGLVVYFGMQLARDRHVSAGADEVTDYGEPVDHFQLTQSTGETFDSNSLEGKVWIASFFFATCPHECRDMNLAKKKLAAEFGHRGVKFVSITCDAETDTPVRLAEEVQRYDADTDTWYFLTGNQQYIEKVGANIFKVHVEPKGHSPHFIVVDQTGEIRGYFNFQNPEEMRNLRDLVNELLVSPPQAQSGGEKVPAASTNSEQPNRSADLG